MKLNILFLLIGLALTIFSKILQFVYKSKTGDLLVIPAAVFFVLTILFSTSKFGDVLSRDNGAKDAFLIGFWTCLAVVSFQIMMMLYAGHGKSYGLLLIIPFVIGVVPFIHKWVTTV